jgi:HSP20 family protein
MSQMSQLLPERHSGQRAREQRWDPLEQLQRVLDETFGGTPQQMPFEVAWVPPVDVEEEDGAYVVEAEVPGVKRDHVNIELVGNELTISGEIKERERKGVLRRQTRRVGRFDYRVMLPHQVDGDKIAANLKDGVLTVRVPKAEQAQRRRVEIK